MLLALEVLGEVLGEKGGVQYLEVAGAQRLGVDMGEALGNVVGAQHLGIRLEEEDMVLVVLGLRSAGHAMAWDMMCHSVNLLYQLLMVLCTV